MKAKGDGCEDWITKCFVLSISSTFFWKMGSQMKKTTLPTGEKKNSPEQEHPTKQRSLLLSLYWSQLLLHLNKKTHVIKVGSHPLTNKPVNCSHPFLLCEFACAFRTVRQVFKRNTPCLKKKRWFPAVTSKFRWLHIFMYLFAPVT